MKFQFKQWIPHLIAVGIFLAVSLLYGKPALEGKVLQQHDWIQWTGMSKDAENYRAQFGEYPQWTQGIFSGMPSYQIAFNTNARVGWLLPEVLGLWLPYPIRYFFLACICFYFLAMALRLRPVFGILGALAFAFATYNPVIISVGHHTKMLCIAMMPAVLAGWVLITQKKYWLGAGVMALFISSMMALNHLQITYYLMLVLALAGISFAVFCIRQKDIRHLIMGAAFALGAVAIGVLSTAVQLFTTYEYAQRSIRGGSALSTDAAAAAGTGLDSAYAMSYSMSLPEPLVVAVPRLFGGSNADALPEDGKLMEVFQQYPGLAQQFPASAYWGGIGGTSGPPYSGAVICFLAIAALVVIDARYRWWMAAGMVLAAVLSWGGYFYGFNGLLLKYLPFYNKFRAPSMAIVILQLLLPMAAVLGLQKLSELNWADAAAKATWKKALIAAAGLAVAILLVYFSGSFTSPDEASIMKQVNQIPDEQTKTVYKAAFSALAEDRRSMAMDDILKTLALGAAALALAWLLLRRTLTPLVAGAILAVIALADLIAVDVNYLNADMYTEPVEYGDNKLPDPELLPSAANLAIQKDTSVYRVFDARQSKQVAGQTKGANTWSDASQAYHHRMVNGYHAAKLSIYQDLIEQQLSKSNMRVYDMLNTKYFIVNDARGGDSVMVNPGALGPAWLVKEVKMVPDAKAEMAALDSLDVRQVAVVQKAYQAQAGPAPQYDSTASISVKEYNNMRITYAVNAPKPQFAVLSEIFYDAGWKATADGKPVPIVKTNYVLRGVALPAGTRELKLVFEPESYKLGSKVTLVMQLLIFVLLGVGIWQWWKQRQTNANA